MFGWTRKQTERSTALADAARAQTGGAAAALTTAERGEMARAVHAEKQRTDALQAVARQNLRADRPVGITEVERRELERLKSKDRAAALERNRELTVGDMIVVGWKGVRTFVVWFTTSGFLAFTFFLALAGTGGEHTVTTARHFMQWGFVRGECRFGQPTYGEAMCRHRGAAGCGLGGTGRVGYDNKLGAAALTPYWLLDDAGGNASQHRIAQSACGHSRPCTRVSGDCHHDWVVLEEPACQASIATAVRHYGVCAACNDVYVTAGESLACWYDADLGFDLSGVRFSQPQPFWQLLLAAASWAGFVLSGYAAYTQCKCRDRMRMCTWKWGLRLRGQEAQQRPPPGQQHPATRGTAASPEDRYLL